MTAKSFASKVGGPGSMWEPVGDQEALAAILQAGEPLACKKIGRTVRNYDDGQWSAARFNLVVAGNIAKFGQNQPLREHLLGSDDAILVEAAPRGQIWGSVSVARILRCRIPAVARAQSSGLCLGKGARCSAR